MKMDARKQKILLALITDFIETADPVGSRTIARKYQLGVSPATIRNELADLEEMGYIEQPHTSSGRVPSHKGYRYYVDFLMEKYDLSKWEERVINDGYEEKLKDVTQVVQRTGTILSGVTGCAAVIIAPRPAVGALKHLQLVGLNPGKAMLVVVSDTGVVQHQAINIPETLLQEDLDVISQVFNAKLQGKSLKSIRMTLLKEVYFELSKHKNILDLALQLLGEHSSGIGEEKIYLGGVFNILNQPEFNNVEKVKTLLSLLEQEELLCQLLESGFQAPGVQIRIGDELLRDEMRECSLISANYQVEGSQGAIGVLGPTRMDYARIISIVEYLACNLSQTLEKLVRNG
ncbi:MAG: heat-inducible transcriptional repressor HrcA [Clostridia bacterium]|nr:heat-inducible transcriptional repressor HrcA [Clostridia bacterium]